MIEQVTFSLGQCVHLVIDPAWKGMVVSIINYADGGRHYEISHVMPNDEIVFVKLFACELESEESL